MIVWLLEKRHNDGLPSIKEVDYLVAVSRPSIRQVNPVGQTSAADMIHPV